MGIKQGELKDTILSKVSIDEFVPKTGDVEDVITAGFYVSESEVGNDVYKITNHEFYINMNYYVFPLVI